MQKIIIALAFIFCSIAGQSQTDSSIVITPGVGIGKLKLGMSEKTAARILNGKIEWVNYTEELKSFTSDDTQIDSVLQFVIGFDSCGRYNSELPEKLPVFSLYFKDHKLNFITVSSYSAPAEQVERVTVTNGLKFHMPMDECTAILGEEYVSLTYGDYTGDRYYYKMGLEAVYDDGVLTAIGIFPSTPNYKALIAEKSAEIKKQVADVLAGKE